jgi:choline dehydrogenase-like flavoprotein
LLTFALCGCGGSREIDGAAAKRNYLAAKDRCVAEYPNSLVTQSDCRTRAANTYIRPFYKYGDLMTRAQEQRRELAAKADRHEISRKTYDREIALSEAAVAREEDRRNKLADTAPASDRGSFASLLSAIAGWLH